jgi:hypothetical protein
LDPIEFVDYFTLGDRWRSGWRRYAVEELGEWCGVVGSTGWDRKDNIPGGFFDEDDSVTQRFRVDESITQRRLDPDTIEGLRDPRKIVLQDLGRCVPWVVIAAPLEDGDIHLTARIFPGDIAHLCSEYLCHAKI